MEFTLNFEQQMLQDSVRRYLEKSYDFETRLSVLKSRREDDGRHWQAFADSGWLAAALPEDYGGLSGSVIDTALIAHEFGRAPGLCGACSADLADGGKSKSTCTMDAVDCRG